MTHDPKMVRRVARTICYQADQRKNGTCQDSICVGECRAVRPDKQHFDQAIAALEASHHAELVEALGLVWQFADPGDIPQDVGRKVRAVLTKIGGKA